MLAQTRLGPIRRGGGSRDTGSHGRQELAGSPLGRDCPASFWEHHVSEVTLRFWLV